MAATTKINPPVPKTSLRIKADQAKKLRCRDLIVVLENPKNLENIGSVIRNIDALGAEKLYVIDGHKLLPNDWKSMRERSSLNKISASAIKWSFVKRFATTEECISHLTKNRFVSFATSPHTKGKINQDLKLVDFTEKRVAIWFGNETKGISPEAVDSCKLCVNIQMSGIIESLNLGTSTGIVIYEATNQRRNFKK